MAGMPIEYPQSAASGTLMCSLSWNGCGSQSKGSASASLKTLKLLKIMRLFRLMKLISFPPALQTPSGPEPRPLRVPF
eukprot:552193-Prorocentrum_minimum.AAC.1